MKTRFLFAILLATVLCTAMCDKLAAQIETAEPSAAVKYEVVSQLLSSNVRHGIGLRDLNGDSLPDLVIGSNAHRFDEATQAINADPNAGFRTKTPVSGHYQVSVHFNETRNTSVSLGRHPQLQVPITSSELVVPPG